MYIPSWITVLLVAVVIALVAVFVGVRRLAMRRIAERPIHDPLTGAYTLEFIREVYQAELRRAERTGVPFSVAVVSIHDPTGTLQRTQASFEELWIALAKWLQSNLRGCDYIGCVDSERFVLILPETWEDDARAVTKRINVSFAHRPKGDSEAIWLTCDIGIATWAPDESDPWALAGKQLKKLAAVATN